MGIFRHCGQAAVAMLAAGIVLLAGCEDGDFKHDPPPGWGSIIVDNRSWDVVHVYVDGIYANDVGDRDYEAYDNLPGVCRVVLDQKGGIRSYSHDVDVIEGKLTVLEVNIDELDWEYDVRIYYKR
jgi:hypothetical protein